MRGCSSKCAARSQSAAIHLEETSRGQLLADAIGAHHQHHGDHIPWEGSLGAQEFRLLIARKDSIESKGKGPISIGYLIYLVRQKTRRPDITLGRDWQAGLAERCTLTQLDQIRFTIINRIAAAEGTGTTRSRNKSQRFTKAIGTRSHANLAPRPGTDFL